jgi:hypothetical protein
MVPPGRWRQGDSKTCPCPLAAGFRAVLHELHLKRSRRHHFTGNAATVAGNVIETMALDAPGMRQMHDAMDIC